MERTIENLRQYIRAGRALIPADTLILHGNLVNVMTSEIYPADVAIYQDMIVAVGDVSAYQGPKTKIIDASGSYLVPGLIDGHIHSECSKLSITSFAKGIVPRGTTSMVSGLDEYISVSGLEGLKEIFAEIKQSPLKVFWELLTKHPTRFPPQPSPAISIRKFMRRCRLGLSVSACGRRCGKQYRSWMRIRWEPSASPTRTDCRSSAVPPWPEAMT